MVNSLLVESLEPLALEDVMAHRAPRDLEALMVRGLRLQCFLTQGCRGKACLRQSAYRKYHST